MLLVVGSIGVALILRHESGPRDPALDRSLPPVVDDPLAPGTPSIRLFALGDTGTGDRGQFEVVEAMTQCVARGGAIDGLLLLGDNIYPDGVTTPDDEQWDAKVVAPYARFGVRIAACLGNHDYNGRIEAQIERSKIDRLWYMPAPYYTFEIPIGDTTAQATDEETDEETIAQFFALETEPMRTRDAADDTQLKWLDSELGRSKARWKIVFGHHPIYSGATKQDSPRLLERLAPILERRGVDIYISAHHHTLQLIGPIAGVRHVVSGAGAGRDNADSVEWRDQAAYAATGGGFVALRLTANQAVVEFVRTNGQTQFSSRWVKP